MQEPVTTSGNSSSSSGNKPRVVIREAIVRFAGDSGDGIQVAGAQFATEAAFAGNDLATFPSFPAEMRAPVGSLYGLSSFQIKFGSSEVYSPGDEVDTLVAMNPAAFKVHLKELRQGGTLIVNSDAFEPKNLTKAGFDGNPMDDTAALERKHRVIKVRMEHSTALALQDLKLSSADTERSKNFFALGLVSWLYDRPIGVTEAWLHKKFRNKDTIAEANVRALRAGYYWGETHEIVGEAYRVEPAHLPPGTYRNIDGNSAIAYGLMAGAKRSGRRLGLASYPITPATDILHELSKHARFGVRILQTEDEIAAIGVAIGMSYAGGVGVTSTSGPGMALKTEALGFAVMAELPLIVVNVQRGGPSTGLPTKTEQSDLLQALFGRNGEAPVIVLASRAPNDCFETAFEAVRLTLKYMTPVVLLSDGFIANGTAPWRIPPLTELPDLSVPYARPEDFPNGFKPYARDPATLARPLAIPGTPGLEHRIGGLEKSDVTGELSHVPENHDRMVRLRAEKVDRVAAEIPPTVVDGAQEGDLLVLGWGSTYGAIAAAVHAAVERGARVGHVHLRYINPLPADLGAVIKRFRRVLIPEINLGQLRLLIDAKYKCDSAGYNRVGGTPLTQAEIARAIAGMLPN